MLLYQPEPLRGVDCMAFQILRLPVRRGETQGAPPMLVAGRVVANLICRSFLVLSLSVLPAAAQTGSPAKPAAKHPAKPAAAKPHSSGPADTAKKDDANAAKKPVDKPKPHDTDTAAKSGKYFQDLIQLPAPSDRSAQDIAAMMGDPKPFTLAAKDAHTIVIYCEAADPKTCDAGLCRHRGQYQPPGRRKITLA